MASWLNNAIFYEIYPQSFNDSNGDGIGDFQGIIDKLQYVHDLGCNAIWINPCFDSSFYDAGYDVRDYYTAAERYGSNADLQRLFERAHELGMHVLLDLVPGHSAVDNPWFLESGKDERNAWTDRYIWRPMTQSPNLNSPYESIRGFLGGIAERPDAAAVNCFSTQACLNYGFGTVTEDWQFAADSPEAVQGRAAHPRHHGLLARVGSGRLPRGHGRQPRQGRPRPLLDETLVAASASASGRNLPGSGARIGMG